MDAPLYPPSARFEPPVEVPQPMTTRYSSFAQFFANPEAKAILFAEAPGFRFAADTPMLKPHLGKTWSGARAGSK